MFRTVFLYKNKIENMIMGTEKAHSIVHSPPEDYAKLLVAPVMDLMGATESG